MCRIKVRQKRQIWTDWNQWAEWIVDLWKFNSPQQLWAKWIRASSVFDELCATTESFYTFLKLISRSSWRVSFYVWYISFFCCCLFPRTDRDRTFIWSKLTHPNWEIVVTADLCWEKCWTSITRCNLAVSGHCVNCIAFVNQSNNQQCNLFTVVKSIGTCALCNLRWDESRERKEF